jgi:hypothetical protein
MSGFKRSTFLAGAAFAVLAPSVARGDDAKHAFRCKAQLDRVRDKRSIRHVEVVVAGDGKSASGIDGSWNYQHMPRAPIGMYALFSVKDGAKLHVKGDFEYGDSDREAAGGNNMVQTNSKTAIEDDFVPGVSIAYPWTIAGEAYLLIVSVEAADPK